MSELSVEEIVARVELDLGRPPDAHEPDDAFAGGIIYVDELRALIASWRKRGEALKEARGWVQDEVNADPRHRGVDVLARIDAALKAAGEK